MNSNHIKREISNFEPKYIKIQRWYKRIEGEFLPNFKAPSFKIEFYEKFEEHQICLTSELVFVKSSFLQNFPHFNTKSSLFDRSQN